MKIILSVHIFINGDNFSTTPDSGNDDELEESNDSILVTSSTYNNSFIDAYIDAEQSPFDGFKKLIDRFNEEYPNTLKITSSDLPKYAILVKIPNGEKYSYKFYYSSEIFYMTEFSTTDMYFYLHYPQSDIGYDIYTVTLNEGGMTFDNIDFYNPFTGSNGLGSDEYWISSVAGSAVIASTFDIYDSEYGSDGVLTSNGSLVFQQPTLRRATTLAPVIQREKTKGILQEVLKEIIQILPLIIVVLVSLVGLRKALKMLFQVLRHS